MQPAARPTVKFTWNLPIGYAPIIKENVRGSAQSIYRTMILKFDKDKLKTFKGIFQKERAISVASKARLGTRTMICRCFLKITSIAKLKNQHIVRSRISEAKFREILKYFTEDIGVSKTSNSEMTLCKVFRKIRILMSKECEK